MNSTFGRRGRGGGVVGQADGARTAHGNGRGGAKRDHARAGSRSSAVNASSDAAMHLLTVAASLLRGSAANPVATLMQGQMDDWANLIVHPYVPNHAMVNAGTHSFAIVAQRQPREPCYRSVEREYTEVSHIIAPDPLGMIGLWMHRANGTGLWYECTNPSCILYIYIFTRKQTNTPNTATTVVAFSD